MIHSKKKRGSKLDKKKSDEKKSEENFIEVNQDEQIVGQEEKAETLKPEEGVIEDLKEELTPMEKLEKQCSDYLNLQQRTLAEFDNFRKRTAKEKASMFDDGVKSTAEKLLPIIDNLERAVAAQESSGLAQDAFYKGVQMTLLQFQEVLKELGVTEIAAIGQKFNPNFHAAVAHEDSDAHGENEVMLCMLKGYQYKDKVIRASMVKVAN